MLSILLVGLTLTMAEPTFVYEVVFKNALSESEVTETLKPLKVLLAQKSGAYSKQKKWQCAIQSKDTKYKVRSRIKEMEGVSRVQIVP